MSAWSVSAIAAERTLKGSATRSNLLCVGTTTGLRFEKPSTEATHRNESWHGKYSGKLAFVIYLA
jgi:hypothetical protein